MKKNQFIEKELDNKIEYFHLLENRFNQKKSMRLILFNQKQQSINIYRQQSNIIDRSHQQFDHFDQLSDNEILHLMRIKQDNERLKSVIYQLKQKIINRMSQNNRYFNEYILLNEKIDSYTQLNDNLSREEKQFQFEKNQYVLRILNLQKTNRLLLNQLEDLKKKSLSIARLHHEQSQKQDQLNRTRVYRSVPSHQTEMTSEDYSKYVKQLTDIIHQCIQWRDRLRSIDQLYFVRNEELMLNVHISLLSFKMKIEQIHEQKRLLMKENNMFQRHRNESRLKQCQAIRAESQMF